MYLTVATAPRGMAVSLPPAVASGLAQAQGVASQFVLNPFWLWAALGVVPLIIFYMARPEPEERTMPSMAFFMKHRKSGHLQRAVSWLRHHLLLLLQLLFIGLLAVAAAGPYTPTGGHPDEVVHVVDLSASMEDDMADAKQFVRSNLGESNTVIAVRETATVPLEGVGPGQVRAWLDTVDVTAVETDIAGGLALAGDMDGVVAIASDLDQSVSDRRVPPLVDDIEAAGRDVAVMETDAGNRWGITAIRPGRGNTSIDVRNTGDDAASVTARYGEAEKTVDIDAGAVETLHIPVRPGRNTVTVGEDAVTGDNTAYLSVPRNETYAVAYIDGTPNRHFETAVGLIPFTSIETYEPPVRESITADIYVLGSGDKLLSGTLRSIESDVEQGSSMVVFANDRLYDRVDKLPVQRNGPDYNASVEISSPRRMSVGEAELHRVNRSRGRALATENAVVRAPYGAGELVFYGLERSRFRFDLLYPVFWKHLFAELVERPDINTLHLETGSSFQGPVTGPDGTMEGRVTLQRAGFYNASGRTYAANLVSEEESIEDGPTIERGGTATAEIPQPYQTPAILALLVLALLEIGYLYREGVV